MFLKNKNNIFKIRRSKVTDYAALKTMSQSIVVQAHNFPLLEILPTCSLDDIEIYPDNIPKDALEGTALTIGTS